jgi:hypothetical protein
MSAINKAMAGGGGRKVKGSLAFIDLLLDCYWLGDDADEWLIDIPCACQSKRCVRVAEVVQGEG